MAEYNWENFDDGEPHYSRDRIHVTISSFGKIYFNQKAFEALGSPDGVALMYERRKSVIGVRASTLHQSGAYRLRFRRKTDNGRIISAINFCKRFSICPEETLAFPSAEVNKDGILILDLNDIRSVKKKRA